MGGYDDAGSFFSLSSTTGKVIWKTELRAALNGANANVESAVYVKSAAIGSSAALDSSSGLLVVGANDGIVAALKMDNGDLAWQFHIPTPIVGKKQFLVVSSPVIDPRTSTVFIGASDKHGSICAINLDDGAEKWCIHTGEGSVGSGVPGSIALHSSGNRSLLYVGANDGLVHCLDATSGNTVWSYQTSGIVYSSPSLHPAENQLYVGSNDGSLYCLDMLTGQKKWAVPTEGWADGSPSFFEAPASSSALVFFGYSNTMGDSPAVQAINATTGQVQFSYCYWFRFGCM